LKKSQHILKSVVEECEKHLNRMNYACGKLISFAPFTVEKIEKLDNEDVAHIDQLVY